MLNVPLLSDAYQAALSGVNEPRSEAAPHGLTGTTACPDRPESPTPQEEDGDGGDAPDDACDDMETARTRPLRMDRLHL